MRKVDSTEKALRDEDLDSILEQMDREAAERLASLTPEEREEHERAKESINWKWNRSF